MRNIPSKIDIQNTIKEETKNLPTEEDIRNEINKIPKTDIKPLEEKLGVLPSKETIELMTDSLSEEIVREHDKTREEIPKNRHSIDKISTEQLQK